MNYEKVIGLEVHAELSTNTKAYCSCKNEFGSPVNTNCCPVCMGFPGILPTLNREVVNYAIKAGLALNCKIREFSKQDRKNYFYPDLGKAYQITQYDLPLCYEGYLDIMVDGVERRIGITRIHIEEDTGKLLHDITDGSLLDFNRAGVPLIEVVTEPDLRSSREAEVFLETVRSILQYIEVSDGKMQEGSIRCDVNVSIREEGQTEFGTRCEMKNVNTFSGAVRAIEYEAKRQEEVITNGGIIDQETRRWDDTANQNFLMRSKENANDYRYFPEANVMPIVVDEAWIESIRETIPELPHIKMRRYIEKMELPEYDAGIITSSKSFSRYFEDVVDCGANPKEASNWCMGEISRLLKETEKTYDEIPVTPQKLAKLIGLIDKKTVSVSAGKKVLNKMFETDEDPEKLVSEMGLSQMNDEGAILAMVTETVAANPQSVEDYKNGRDRALGFLVGQIMKKSKGKANPQMVSDMVKDALEKA